MLFEEYLILVILKTYAIGLIFGLIYTIWFCDVKSWRPKEPKDTKASILIFLVTMIVSILLFLSIAAFLNMQISYLASINTNFIAAILMALLCFVTSLFLFGFINISRVHYRQPKNTNSIVLQIWQYLRIAFNFRFLWFLLNAILLSQYIMAQPFSMYSSILGMLTIVNFKFVSVLTTET